MRRFFKRLFLPLAVICVVLGQAVSMHSCTQVDDTLGDNYIPDHQKVKMKIDTVGIGSILSYIVKSDSTVANYRRQMLFGSMMDPVFGRTHAGTIVKFFPYSNEFNDGNLFGYNPVGDSIKLTLYIRDIYGKNEVEQKFNVYALKDSLPRDSMYYTNLDIVGLGLVDLDDPLFSFTTKDETTTATVFPMDTTHTGGRYLQKLVNVDSAIMAEPYYKFPPLFNGLYIAPAPDSPEDAAIYNVELYNDTYSQYSLFTLYFHNYERNTNPPVEDTVTYTYYVFDSGDDLAIPNMEVNLLTHEYPIEIERHLNDTSDTSAALPLVYIQGLDGVSTYLKFTDEFIKEIDDLRFHDGVEYRNITINQAVLYLYLDDVTADTLDDAPFKIGTYTNYAGYTPTPIIDYAYTYEGATGYTVPYGGNLNRSNGYYALDLSIYVSFLLYYPETVGRTVWLGPSITTSKNNIIENYSQVVLNGSQGDMPMRMVLTYTLVK